jgi:hypothetical protein
MLDSPRVFVSVWMNTTEYCRIYSFVLQIKDSVAPVVTTYGSPMKSSLLGQLSFCLKQQIPVINMSLSMSHIMFSRWTSYSIRKLQEFYSMWYRRSWVKYNIYFLRDAFKLIIIFVWGFQLLYSSWRHFNLAFNNLRCRKYQLVIIFCYMHAPGEQSPSASSPTSYSVSNLIFRKHGIWDTKIIVYKVIRKYKNTIE